MKVFMFIIFSFLLLNIHCAPVYVVTEEKIIEKEPINEELLNKSQADSIALAEEAELRAELINLYKAEIFMKNQNKANLIVDFYVHAQQNLYSGNLEYALYLINQAALIKENADVLALRGSIYLGLGNKNKFISEWRKALLLDPDITNRTPDYIIQELQNFGLID